MGNTRDVLSRDPHRACLAARGESPAAFGERCIPPGCVAPRSNTPGILTRRALPSGRIAALDATPDFHHGLLVESILAEGAADRHVVVLWLVTGEVVLDDS